jgi:damage-control phosphatase, subfamily I
MRTHLDCFPCFLRQSLIALKLVTEDEAWQETVVKNILEYIRNADSSKPPAYTTTFIHRKIRQMLGEDPFKEIKSKYNKIALSLYPSLKVMTEKSHDPLLTSARLAIAGNVIDFGIFTSINIEGTIDRALNNPLSVDDYRIFRDSVGAADEILYLTDNAGEIVFDRLLIEELIAKGKKIQAVVKGSPVINDATLSDAEESGLIEVCEVMENGSDGVGTILEWTSSEFQKTFNNAQLVISKGQGNFETLSGTKKKIFFFFQSKCNVVSEELGLSTGSMLLKKS